MRPRAWGCLSRESIRALFLQSISALLALVNCVDSVTFGAFPKRSIDQRDTRLGAHKVADGKRKVK